MTNKWESARGMCRKIRAILREGPSTVDEIAVELQVNRRTAQLATWILTYNNQAESQYSVPRPDEAPYRSRKTRKVYRLTGYGNMLATRDLHKRR